MATAMAHGAAMEAAMAQREEVVPVPPPPAAPPPPAGAVATARPAPVASAPPSEFATVLSLQVPVAHSNGAAAAAAAPLVIAEGIAEGIALPDIDLPESPVEADRVVGQDGLERDTSKPCGGSMPTKRLATTPPGAGAGAGVGSGTGAGGAGDEGAGSGSDAETSPSGRRGVPAVGGAATVAAAELESEVRARTAPRQSPRPQAPRAPAAAAGVTPPSLPRRKRWF